MQMYFGGIFLKKSILVFLSVFVGLLVVTAFGLTYYFHAEDSNLKQSEGPKTEAPQTKISDENGYTFMNKKLYFTLDYGENWLKVPATMEEFFGGEYELSGNELLENTYLISKGKLGLLIVMKKEEGENLVWLESLDQGKKWKEYPVAKNFQGIRFRKIVFLNKNFGYVLVSGGRVVRQESFGLYATEDAGHTWTEVPTNKGISNTGTLIQDGGFISETMAFICREKEMYVTQNAGQLWQQATFNVPDNYKNIFITPEIPYQEAGHLYVDLNQGDSGDYKGGKVKGQFESKDNGVVWNFVKEVEGDSDE